MLMDTVVAIYVATYIVLVLLLLLLIAFQFYALLIWGDLLWELLLYLIAEVL